jgi:N-acetylmuramoyl-L-alanine amidase
MRSGPSTSSGVVASLKRGTKVDYLGDQQGYWVKVRYNGQTGYVHKLYLKLKNEQGSSVANRVIVLDAGHGGKDPGASGNGVVEKELVLDIAQRVQKKLEAAGATVIMTRTDAATYPELKDRTDLAQSKYADMFVSVHTNSAPSAPSANGSEVYYDTSQNTNGSESAILAKEIQEQFVSLVGMNDRGTKDNDFYVVRNTDMPSVLVELGFLTNSGDAAKFKSDYYRNLFAEAIYLGIKNYYSL